MSLTVNLDQITLDALQADAHIRNVSCEDIVCELIKNHYASPKSLTSEEEALFRAKVEEGREAIRRGDYCANEEVLSGLEERRARILARIASK